MITLSFLWLILSHLSVLFPLIIGYKLDKKRNKTTNLVLVSNNIFSIIYHWVDQVNFNITTFNILGTSHDIYAFMDFYLSYLSFFVTIYYTFNPMREPKYIDFSMVLINMLCVFITLLDIPWFVFLSIIFVFMMIYYYFTKDKKWKKIIRKMRKNKLLVLLMLIFSVTPAVIQYGFAVENKVINLPYYQILHGIWHLLIYACPGFCMIFSNEVVHLAQDDILDVIV